MPVGTIWSPEEDEQLAQLVIVHGPKKWSQIASELGTKGSKQCRRRWKNYISLDDRKQGSWTAEEDAQLLDGHRRHGNKWTIIAQEIGGRTDNAVKNRWAALGKKRKFDDDPSAPRNDLLSVRRIIYKDQPSHRAATAAEAAWLQEQFGQNEQQVPYSIPAAMLGVQQQQTDITHLNNLPRKPDLMINIPGATALEVPYSQRSQGNIEFRVNKGSLTPVEMQLAQELNGMDLPVQIRVEDDTLLSTSRQAAQNAIAALASPTEEPGTITSLYKYLCSATPQDAQQQVTSGRRSPPPWGSRSDLTQGMMQQQPQTLQPAQQPGLLQHQQQQQLLLPVTGQMPQQQVYQQLQMPQQQVPMLLPQAGRALQQQQQSAQMLQQPAAVQYQHAPPQHQMLYGQPVMINNGHKMLVQKVARMCAGQEYSATPAGYSPSLPGSMPPAASFAGSEPGAGAGGVMQGGHMVLTNTMQQGLNSQQLQQGQQMRYPQGTWQQQQQGHSSAGHYNPPVVTSGSNSMPVGCQPEQQQQQMLPPPMRYEEQKQWGPEELRQLLDLLGDQQQQQGMCAAGGAAGPGQPPQQHSPPEEEVEQVNNGHGRIACHAGRGTAQLGMGLMAPECAAGCRVPPLGPSGGMVCQ